MLESRAGLPMADVKNDLLAKLSEGQRSCCSGGMGGETGCGKTTQVC